jgi:hypothetical protein
MSRKRRHDKQPTEVLTPTFSPPGHSFDRQVAYMEELRGLSNQIAERYQARDDLLLALAMSESLSRRDMATACGLNKSRVDQIIKEMAERHEQRQSAMGQARGRRHLPQ